MRTSHARPAAQLNARSPKLQVKRSFVTAPNRDIRTRACYIEPPRKLWDRIVLLLFTCCLFTFLHAFFGFGDVDKDLRVLNHTFVHPRPHFPASSPWNQHSVAVNEDQNMRAPSVTRVTIDWNGDYELFPSPASDSVPPASIPQDAFPDPTPAMVRAERGRALDKRPPFMTTKVKTPVNTPSAFYGAPYDPFRLVFEDSVDEGEHHGLYPIAGPPRTARTRRFGRCFPGEACL